MNIDQKNMREDRYAGKSLKPAYKIWIEDSEGYVFGRGVFELLEKIEETGSLSGGAKALDMSYRHAWGVIKRTEKRVGKPLLRTYKGGKGGGGAELTGEGRELMKAYIKFKESFDLLDREGAERRGPFTRLDAINRVFGDVVSVEKGDSVSKVQVKIETPCMVTSFIKNEVVEKLHIKKGNKVAVVMHAFVDGG